MRMSMLKPTVACLFASLLALIGMQVACVSAKQAEANAKPAPKEFQGPKGPEPTRYGDWETKGIASDF